MSSKTKIVVLHLKELIYTGIFVVLGILFVILLAIMFLPGKKDNKNTDRETPPAETAYVPGVYATSLVLNDHTVDIEVVVDENNINSIRLVNLDEAITTMYPLIQPSLDDLAVQIYDKQSLEGITYADESKYTSLVLLDAIQTSLQKAQPDAEKAD